jgi:hypothetical protein
MADPYLEPDESDVEFRLTYEGKLLAHREPVGPRALHKHDIRKRFHIQLKALWETHPALVSLSEQTVPGVDHQLNKALHFLDEGSPLGDDQPQVPYLDWAGANWERNGFRWIPLVTERSSLICKLEILMLRRGAPGQLVSKGDIDNRIKTILTH